LKVHLFIGSLLQNLNEVIFDKGSLKHQRFLTAVDMMDSTKTRAVSRELWMRNWNRVGLSSTHKVSYVICW